MAENISREIYRERVLPGLAFFSTGLSIPIISTLIATPFLVETLWIVPTLTYGGYVLLGFLAAPVIKIDEDFLFVAGAKVPREFIVSAIEVPASDRFLERGHNLNARAYVKFQVGVKGLVKVSITDPKDPTPYWLFASRNPDLVAKFLNKQV